MRYWIRYSRGCPRLNRLRWREFLFYKRRSRPLIFVALLQRRSLRSREVVVFQPEHDGQLAILRYRPSAVLEFLPLGRRRVLCAYDALGSRGGEPLLLAVERGDGGGVVDDREEAVELIVVVHPRGRHM